MGPLRASLLSVIQSVSGPRNGGSLRLPGVQPTLKTRLKRGLETESVPASMFHLPGPNGLRRALQAIREAGADEPLAGKCEKCIARYEQFLSDENLTLDSMQSMLSDFLPEARDEVLLRNSRSVFTAMRNISGISADAMVVVMILYPGSQDRDYHEGLIRGFMGWERLRGDAWPHAHGSQVHNPGDSIPYPAQTLDGQPLSGKPNETLLEEFCHGPVPQFQLQSEDASSVLYVDTPEIGVRSSCSFLFGERLPDAISRRPDGPDDGRFRLFSAAVRVPIRRLLFDVILHDEVWPGITPQVDTYRTVPDGRVHEPDMPARQWDRIDLGAALRVLPRGLKAVETSTMGGYRRLINHVFSRLGQSPAAFRGYRLDLAYPLYGMQYTMRFDVSSLGG